MNDGDLFDSLRQQRDVVEANFSSPSAVRFGTLWPILQALLQKYFHQLSCGAGLSKVMSDLREYRQFSERQMAAALKLSNMLRPSDRALETVLALLRVDTRTLPKSCVAHVVALSNININRQAEKEVPVRIYDPLQWTIAKPPWPGNRIIEECVVAGRRKVQ